MNFKEALIAHLQGEKVECNHVTWQEAEEWKSLEQEFTVVKLKHVGVNDCSDYYKFRIAPRTIFVNGVEVPAPEKVVPEYGIDCFIPMPAYPMGYVKMAWTGDVDNVFALQEGLLYLKPTDAIARAKAMLLTSDKREKGDER